MFRGSRSSSCSLMCQEGESPVEHKGPPPFLEELRRKEWKEDVCEGLVGGEGANIGM